MPRPIFLAFNVSDVERSVAFYRDGFGIEFHYGENEPVDDTWYGGYHASVSWHDGAYLHFAMFPSLAPERCVTTNAQIGFQVENIEKAHRKAVDFGVVVIHPPRQEPWGITARYRDPDGNLVSVTEN